MRILLIFLALMGTAAPAVAQALPQQCVSNVLLPLDTLPTGGFDRITRLRPSVLASMDSLPNPLVGEPTIQRGRLSLDDYRKADSIGLVWTLADIAAGESHTDRSHSFQAARLYRQYATTNGPLLSRTQTYNPTPAHWTTIAAGLRAPMTIGDAALLRDFVCGAIVLQGAFQSGDANHKFYFTQFLVDVESGLAAAAELLGEGDQAWLEPILTRLRYGHD